MAHFAKLDGNNQVIDIILINNKHMLTEGGIERETIGLAYIEEQYGVGNWKQCSCKTSVGVHRGGRTPLRANYPGIGSLYNPTHDIFHEPLYKDKDGDVRTSWTLNTTKGIWEPPIACPGVPDAEYKWDESLYQSDNTKGWVAV